jgi:hypothetical protein
MKEILYIPSGKYFRFINENGFTKESTPRVSAEEYIQQHLYTYGGISVEDVVYNIIHGVYIPELYKEIEVDKRTTKLIRSEFEIVDI